MRKILSLFLVTVVSAVAVAQQGSYSSRGQGYVYVDGEKTVVDRVTVDLNRGGNVSFRFNGPDGSRSAAGSWNGSGLRVTFDIDSGLVSNRINGEGAISFFSDRKGIRGISFTGTTRGREVKISFLDQRGEVGSNQSGSGSNWGGNTSNYTAPSWAVGSFHGHNRSYNADVSLNIERNGDARATIRYSDGRRQVQTGRFRDNRLTLEGTQFKIRQSGSGITSEQVGDANNWVEYSRGAGNSGGGNSANVPSWLEGTFTGRNRLYDAQMEFEIRDNGRVTVHIRYPDGRVQTQSGRYDGNNIVIENVRFNVSKTFNGIRLVQQDDRDNSADYRRR